MFQVEFRPEAISDLERLDKPIAQRILKKLKWFSENFEMITPLVLRGQWQGRYKLVVGDYRVIYTVNYMEKLIAVHLVGHRKEIYR
jgi:mRNA interferase RelE/StbE